MQKSLPTPEKSRFGNSEEKMKQQKEEWEQKMNNKTKDEGE